MSAPEEIVLPRSGYVLRRVPKTDNAYRAPLVRINRYLAGGCEVVYHDDSAEEFANEADGIAALDADVLYLRAALLAGTEERIARWIVERNADRYGRSWEDTPDCQRDDARSAATDLISALTGGSDDPA